MGGDSTAQNELGLHLTDAATLSLAGAQISRQTNGTFLYRGKVLPLSFRGGQNVRIAKLTQGFEAGVGEVAAKSLFAGSVILNGYDAYNQGFSARADTKAAVGTAIAGLALVQPEIGIPVAIVYSGVDMFGGWDWAYNHISDKPLINTGTSDK